jgi:uncharacterized membrane protein (UPF0182 family)
MEENLEQALSRMFTGTSRPMTMDIGQPAGAHGLKTLIRQAQERFEKAQAHLKRGEWAQYGQEMKALEQVIRRMSEMP